MNAMKIAKEGDESLRQLLQSPGNLKNIEDIARAVADPANADIPATRVIDETAKRLRKFGDQINTFRINALLSGPGTQEVNMISNAINSLVIPTEQALGAIRSGDRRLFTHALRQFQGYTAGLFDSVKSALDAGWWDEAILDPFSGKIEEDALAKATTTAGKVVTLPCRECRPEWRRDHRQPRNANRYARCGV